MKKNILFIVSILVLSLALCGCGAKGEEAANQDNEKESQEIKKDVPNRTVAGTIAVLEMLDYLEIEMVGIPETKIPLDDKFSEVPNIGNPMTPDMELLKSVNPDMFISVTSLKEDLKGKIEQNDIQSLFLDNSSYSTMLESMQILGTMYGKEEISNKYVENVKSKSDEIKEKVSNEDQPRVMILFGTPRSIMFATKNSFVGSLIEELGAINVVGELDDFKDNFVPVSMEHVLELKPDIILRLTHASPEESKKMFDDEFGKSDIWQKLNAVKQERVYDLDNKYFGVSGNIRIIEAFESLEEILYE